MIPNANSPIAHQAKFLLLEEGDYMLPGDEYYNNFQDKWLPIEKDQIGIEWLVDESKPVRRINGNYTGNDIPYYQPEFVNGEPPVDKHGRELFSFQVYRGILNAKADFPNHNILTYSGNDIEDASFID